MKTQHLLFCLFGAMVLTRVAYAEVNVGKQTPTVNQVIDALNPAKANPDTPQTDDTDYEGDVKTGKSRSIDMSKMKAPSKTTINRDRKKPIPITHRKETDIGMSMEIIFGYNSAELTAEAKEQLKPVGEALASETLKNLSFVVEGHTDAVGGQAYNKTLSEERAASVKQFLVKTFNIEASHIQIIGKGKSDLFDPNNPASEKNRRVRFVTVTAQ